VLRGVEEIRTLDGAVLRSGEARRLAQVADATPIRALRS
jgi:DNA gyrase subunit B